MKRFYLKRKEMPRLVALFSGCGSMDKGFKEAGCNIVFANDFDKDAQAVYKLNFGAMRDHLSGQCVAHKSIRSFSIL